MSEKLSQNSERSPMSASAEAATLVRELAEPRPIGDTVKAALRRAARLVGFSPGRTKAIWYGEARRINAEEIDILRATNARRREQIGKLVAVRSAVAAEGSGLDSESVSRFIDMVRRMGAEDRAGDFPKAKDGVMRG